MKLSLQAISDFKAIYLNKFGIELTDDEANLKGLELLDFMKLIYKKVPNEHQQMLESLDVADKA